MITYRSVSVHDSVANQPGHVPAYSRLLLTFSNVLTGSTCLVIDEMLRIYIYG
jgi:hypothetical protein